MRTLGVVGVALSVVAMATAAASAPAQPKLSHDERVTALQRYLEKQPDVGATIEERRGAMFMAGFVDLDGDGVDEALVYGGEGGWCGTGGCGIGIFVQQGRGYRLKSSTSIGHLPVGVLSSRHHGWRDITSFQAGGGIRPGYMAVLPFNGSRYPLNPTVPPARPLRGHPPTEVVIADNDYSYPVFGTYERRSLSEWGLEAAFPKGAQVCDNTSGTHIHGWGLALSGACGNMPRNVSVIADYNATFLRSAREASSCDVRRDPSVEVTEGYGWTLPRHRSFNCKKVARDGMIELIVATQYGRWRRGPTDGPEFNTPYINLSVSLTTDAAHFDEDADTFRAVLGSIHLRDQSVGADRRRPAARRPQGRALARSPAAAQAGRP